MNNDAVLKAHDSIDALIVLDFVKRDTHVTFSAIYVEYIPELSLFKAEGRVYIDIPVLGYNGTSISTYKVLHSTDYSKTKRTCHDFLDWFGDMNKTNRLADVRYKEGG